MPKASIVVPCYNEANRLDVCAFRKWLAGEPPARLLFVDDGSLDDTFGVLEEVCRGYEERASVIRRSVNSGKAEAVRVGVLHALNDFKSEFVGYWDADLATPLDAIENFMEILDTQPAIEMVFGSRVKLLGRFVERRPARHYLGRVFATVVSVMLRLPVYDTQCGAKLFRVNEHTPAVFAQPFLSKWVFDVEILARYLKIYGGDPARLEKVIYEYPLQRWKDIAGSKVRAHDFLIAFWDIMKIKRRYL